jgi:hypothetical protein
MILDWLSLHKNQLFWGIGIFAISLLFSSLACCLVILQLREDHFHLENSPRSNALRPLWKRNLLFLGKNILGVSLVILGLVMSLPGVPGQGLLTMFIGMVLVDFPGKRNIERRIISRPAILDGCNRLRLRFGKKPFTLDSGPLLVPGKTKSEDEIKAE